MRLSRREMLASLLGAPLAATLAACEPERPEAPEVAGDNHDPNFSLGHLLRTGAPSDAAFEKAPMREADVVIVGGGPSGLAAARQLTRRGVERVQLLELEPELGGTSMSGSSPLTGFPWGAHYITRPLSHNRQLIALLDEMGVYEAPGQVREEYLVREPKERLYYRGFFYEGLYPALGADRTDVEEWRRFQAHMRAFAALRDGRGRPAFAIPVRESSDDAALTALDRISAADWLRQEGYRSTRLRWMVDYACRDDYGLLAEHTSAWALVLYFAARIDPHTGHGTEVITWPQGNGALIAHLRRRCGAEVARGKLVLDVRPDTTGVVVHALDAATQKPLRYRARRAILATPQFITQRVVRPLRERADAAREGMQYGAWMVANLQLDGRPHSNGCEEAWDNVLFDSPSLGYVSATHQRGRSFGPSVWTYYLPMTDARAAAGRKRLFEASHQDLTDAILSDLGRAHVDLRKRVQRIDTRRWGHAMVQPRVGHVWHAGRRTAQTPLGPIHFAHSDLSGIALFEEAFDQGTRAAEEVAEGLTA